MWVLIALLALIAFANETRSGIVAAIFDLYRREGLALLVAMATFAVVLVALSSWAAVRLWHDFANALAEKTPHPLRKPWIVDGDTIDDLATGVRYRFANIDAPETGDSAQCFFERSRGEMAKWAAVDLIRSATLVSVRRTFRHDIYGRRVAYVLVDGADLGELLMQRGLARPWRGRRFKWCGPKGGLALIAADGAMPHACKTCGVAAPQLSQGGAGRSR